MAQGNHPFPSRTRKLSPAAPMVLPLDGGRVGRCQAFFCQKLMRDAFVARLTWGGRNRNGLHFLREQPNNRGRYHAFPNLRAKPRTHGDPLQRPSASTVFRGMRGRNPRSTRPARGRGGEAPPEKRMHSLGRGTPNSFAPTQIWHKGA